MEQTGKDDLLVNLLVNKAKLAQSLHSNTNSSQENHNVSLTVESINEHNQILTLANRLEKLEKDVLFLQNIVHCSKHIAKCKKE